MCFKDLTKAVDKIGSTHEYNPFYEANESRLPALIAYDSDFIEPMFGSVYYLWNARDEENLLTATRAVIFLPSQ